MHSQVAKKQINRKPQKKIYELKFNKNSLKLRVCIGSINQFEINGNSSRYIPCALISGFVAFTHTHAHIHINVCMCENSARYCWLGIAANGKSPRRRFSHINMCT